jgi:hypothetical protein
VLGQITLNSLKDLFSQSNISKKKKLFSTKYEFENLFFLSSTPSFSTWFSNCVQNQAKHKIKELETKFLDFLENCNKGCLEEPLRPTFNISGEKKRIRTIQLPSYESRATMKRKWIKLGRWQLLRIWEALIFSQIAIFDWKWMIWDFQSIIVPFKTIKCK